MSAGDRELGNTATVDVQTHLEVFLYVSLWCACCIDEDVLWWKAKCLVLGLLDYQNFWIIRHQVNGILLYFIQWHVLHPCTMRGMYNLKVEPTHRICKCDHTVSLHSDQWHCLLWNTQYFESHVNTALHHAVEQMMSLVAMMFSSIWLCIWKSTCINGLWYQSNF